MLASQYAGRGREGNWVLLPTFVQSSAGHLITARPAAETKNSTAGPNRPRATQASRLRTAKKTMVEWSQRVNASVERNNYKRRKHWPKPAEKMQVDGRSRGDPTNPGKQQRCP